MSQSKEESIINAAARMGIHVCDVDLNFITPCEHMDGPSESLAWINFPNLLELDNFMRRVFMGGPKDEVYDRIIGLDFEGTRWEIAAHVADTSDEWEDPAGRIEYDLMCSLYLPTSDIDALLIRLL